MKMGRTFVAQRQSTDGVAEDIVGQLDLRVETVDDKMRYVSAWFDGELTNLEGAE